MRHQVFHVSQALAFLLVFTLGCSGASNPVDDPELPGRSVSVASVQWGDPASEPLAIYLSLSASADPRFDGSRDILQGIVKLEVNFGDTSGWHDATEWFTDYFTPPYDNTLDGMLLHTYDVAGTYTLSARATFWDGALIYWDKLLDTHRRVTVPYLAQEHDGQPWPGY